METTYKDLLPAISENALKEYTLNLMYARHNDRLKDFMPVMRKLCSPPINAYPQLDPAGMDERQLFLYLLRFVHPDRHAWLKTLAEKAYHDRQEELLKALHSIFRQAGTRHRRPDPAVANHGKESYSYDEGDFDDSYSFRDAGYTDEWMHDEDREHDLFSAIAAACLGNVNIQLDVSDLTHLSGELILQGYGLDDLDGLSWCVSVTVLDLSHNNISNLYDLQELVHLEELDLSHNNIDDIHHLEGLTSLSVLDLSHNDIEDISPLRNLPNLSFVDISANPCIKDRKTINTLMEQGVIVITFG